MPARVNWDGPGTRASPAAAEARAPPAACPPAWSGSGLGLGFGFRLGLGLGLGLANPHPHPHPHPHPKQVGREVVSRFVTNLLSAGEMLTDSNAREMMARRRANASAG